MTPDRLPRHWTLACACALVLAGLAPAVAQFLPGPGATRARSISARRRASPAHSRRRPGRAVCNRAARKPVLAAGGAFPPPSNSVCQQFPPIRQAAEQGAAGLRAAGERKAPREEVCGLFKSFLVKEARLVKFLADNKTACGVPRTGHRQRQVQPRQDAADCQERLQRWPGGGGRAGPTLSDALGGPIIADDTSAKQPGTGTFNTLTGNVLSR